MNGWCEIRRGWPVRPICVPERGRLLCEGYGHSDWLGGAEGWDIDRSRVHSLASVAAHRTKYDQSSNYNDCNTSYHTPDHCPD